MVLKHKVNINVTDSSGKKIPVLKGGTAKIFRKILNVLFGECCEVVVLMLGQSVQGIEIHEIKEGEKHHE